MYEYFKLILLEPVFVVFAGQSLIETRLVDASIGRLVVNRSDDDLQLFGGKLFLQNALGDLEVFGGTRKKEKRGVVADLTCQSNSNRSSKASGGPGDHHKAARFGKHVYQK